MSRRAVRDGEGTLALASKRRRLVRPITSWLDVVATSQAEADEEEGRKKCAHSGPVDLVEG
jgi:hypothetical protein